MQTSDRPLGDYTSKYNTRVENPFRYGEVVGEPHLAGRDRERAELASDIRSGQNVVIISPRRYGKSSLILDTLRVLADEGVIHAYLDLTSVTSYARLPDALATAIARGLLGRVERARDRVLEWLSGLPVRPSFGYSPDDNTFTVEFTGLTQQRTAERTVEELLHLPQRIATRTGRRVALVLDEFQNVVDLDKHLPAVMRSLFQHQSDVCHVFLGSKRHLMERLFTDDNEPMFRMAKMMPLKPIDRVDFAAFVDERFRSTKTPIAPDAVDRVLDVTLGHPNDTQQLCYFLWNLAAVRDVFPIPARFVDDALEAVVDADSARFEVIWDRLRGKMHRAVLAAIAADPEVGVYTSAFNTRHRLGSATEVQKAIRSLEVQGLIEQTSRREAHYRVTETFLPFWLRRIGAVG